MTRRPSLATGRPDRASGDPEGAGSRLEPTYIALDVKTANPGWASILPDAPGPPTPAPRSRWGLPAIPGIHDRGPTRTTVGPSPANRRDFAYPYIACGRKVASPGRSPMSTRSASIASQKGMIPR